LSYLAYKHNTMKRFVIGDIHGHVKALEQCLDRSGFDMKNDTLICLGDAGDRGPNTKETFDLLLQIKNLIYIKGNHDTWLLNWALGEYDIMEGVWIYNGGNRTIKSYDSDPDNVPESHIELLKNALLYHLTDDNKLFVHGGIDPHKAIEEQNKEGLLWDRDFVFETWDEFKKGVKEQFGYDEIYLGHTPTTSLPFNSDVPLNLNGVWMMDTGAAWGHKLSIMNIDTKEVWQSDETR